MGQFEMRGHKERAQRLRTTNKPLRPNHPSARRRGLGLCVVCRIRDRVKIGSVEMMTPYVQVGHAQPP